MNSESLNHIEAIKRLLLTIQASDRMHAVIIEGPPGWGKTTAVEDALRMAGVAGVHLGSYSTPLHFFNFLHDNSRSTVVIDDCAGLFSDQGSMAILKAATWGQGKQRKIRWGSTSSKASVEEFYFEGKLVIVCNSFPATADAQAVKSRSFPYKIDIDLVSAKALLSKAAANLTLYSEFADHQRCAKKMKVQIYFCDAYSSYQRGTNENRIGISRQYLPKKTDLSDLTNAQLKKIEFEINNRPMKCLDWLTPYEVMMGKSCAGNCSQDLNSFFLDSN